MSPVGVEEQFTVPVGVKVVGSSTTEGGYNFPHFW
jgi:hypothetical protein